MRKQAKTKDGTLRWAVTYPKAFQGDKAVAKPLKEKPTYGKNMQIIKKTYDFTIVITKYLVNSR